MSKQTNIRRMKKPREDFTPIFGGGHFGPTESTRIPSPNGARPIPRTSFALKRLLKKFNLRPAQLEAFWKLHKERVEESERECRAINAKRAAVVRKPMPVRDYWSHWED